MAKDGFSPASKAVRGQQTNRGGLFSWQRGFSPAHRVGGYCRNEHGKIDEAGRLRIHELNEDTNALRPRTTQFHRGRVRRQLRPDRERRGTGARGGRRSARADGAGDDRISAARSAEPPRASSTPISRSATASRALSDDRLGILVGTVRPEPRRRRQAALQHRRALPRAGASSRATTRRCCRPTTSSTRTATSSPARRWRR